MALAIFDLRIAAVVLLSRIHDFKKLRPGLSKRGELSLQATTGTAALAAAPFVMGD
jgi:hypothetical protein